MSETGPGAVGWARIARAGLFSAGAVWLSVVAHVSAGGGAPPHPVLGGMILFTAVVTSALAGRRRGALSIGALLAGCQVAFHELFMLFGERCAPGFTTTGGHTAHGTVAMSTPDCAMAGPMHTGAGMVVAHAVAALVLALLLARGEHAAWALLQWVLPRLPRTTPQLPSWVGPPARRRRPAGKLRRAAVPGEVGRRGPPTALGALA